MRGRFVQLAALVTMALIGTGCARVPDGAATAINVRCPEGSDCYDPPMALGEGGDVTFTAVDFAFPEVTGVPYQGDIAVTLDNNADGEHNIVFEGANTGSDETIVAAGQSEAEGTVNLFSGDYVYFCNIPGHRASGMEGSLTVYATEELAAEAAEEGGQPVGAEGADNRDDVTDGNESGAEVAGQDTSEGSLEDPDNESDQSDNVDGELGAEGVTAAEDAAGGAGGGGEVSINVANQYDTAAGDQPDTAAGGQSDTAAGGQLVADDLTEDSVADLDDSGDIAAALDDKGFARAYQLTFASGSTTLEEDGGDVLDQIEALLADDPDLELRIEGNTDTDGDPEANRTLSQDRAAAVVAALIDRGVEPTQLSAVGNGQDNLLVEDETNDLAKQANRRIEIYLVR